MGPRPLPAGHEAHDRRGWEDGCVVVAVGAREHQNGPGWGGYTVDEVALRHSAGVEKETTDPEEAYAAVRERFGSREHSAYREGWLSD